MLHKLAHLLGWNLGKVVSKLDDDGNVWVGFQCTQCGKISGKYKTRKLI